MAKAIAHPARIAILQFLVKKNACETNGSGAGDDAMIARHVILSLPKSLHEKSLPEGEGQSIIGKSVRRD